MEQKKYHEELVSSYIEQNSHTNIKTVPVSTQNIITTTKHRDRLHTIFLQNNISPLLRRVQWRNDLIVTHHYNTVSKHLSTQHS
jgi:hypothetical protein